MHIMLGELLDHLLPAALRVALGIPPVAGAGSDVSERTSDSEEEEGVCNGYRCQPGDRENNSESFQGNMGGRKPLEYGSKVGDGNMMNASCGWRQQNALVVGGWFDKVWRV